MHLKTNNNGVFLSTELALILHINDTGKGTDWEEKELGCVYREIWQ